MSYHVYTTEGIILKRTPFGEANIMLHVLTEDFGLILASARSARLSVSKLRPALQEFEYVSITCIKGKSGWKITNVVGKENFYFEYPHFTHRVLAQITSVLLKMIQGESPHKEVFHLVAGAFRYLKDISKEDIGDFERLLVVRILYELGYVAKTPDIEAFLSDYSWSPELLRKVSENKIMIVSLINKALQESHL